MPHLAFNFPNPSLYKRCVCMCERERERERVNKGSIQVCHLFPFSLVPICLILCTCRISEWQRRYQARDSKPEDLETIRELKMIVREQEQRMKEFNVCLSNYMKEHRLNLVMNT